jgi:hypothetical protein
MPSRSHRHLGGPARSVIGTLALLLCASGCSGGSAQRSAHAGPTATTKQYASLIAQNDMTSDLEQFTSECVSNPSSALCALKPQFLSSSAAFLVKALKAAHASIGDPPSEIASLVAQTEAKATDLSVAAEAWINGCLLAHATESSPCIAKWIRVTTAAFGLQDELAGWKPYLG